MFNFKMLISVFLVVSGKCLFLQMFKNDETTVYPGVVIKSSELDVSSSQVDIKIFCNRTMLCCSTRFRGISVGMLLFILCF